MKVNVKRNNLILDGRMHRKGATVHVSAATFNRLSPRGFVESADRKGAPIFDEEPLTKPPVKPSDAPPSKSPPSEHADPPVDEAALAEIKLPPLNPKKKR